MTRRLSSADEIASAIIERVGPKIVLGLPVGIGKAIDVANALYLRAAHNPALSLTIFSGLTLERPDPRNDIEQRFLGPLVDRLYADWPDAAYAAALRDDSLPPNIEVHEFYLRPGAWLDNECVQRAYSSINYSQVAHALRELGVNVIAQLVAPHPQAAGRVSLGSNPEVTLDLLPWFRERRAAGGAAIIAQLNAQMPYMIGAAELDAGEFDFILDESGDGFPLFSLPNRRVTAADYATGMHVASLVPDGGTLQIGIGSLSDAVAHCLRLRNDEPEVFESVLAELPGGSRAPGRAALPIETRPFAAGLYAATELLSDAMFSLFERGIVRRPADADDDACIHAGFFIGSGRFYEALASLPEERRRRIAMSPISFVNTLYGDETRKRAQRRDARFVNETMMATLLGAAVSDALEDGRVVSGVGGQFDFVSMAHSLDDAHSVLMLRAWRAQNGRPVSNIRWNYAHTTVPRHHRDLFVTEYGIAATRGQPDEAVVRAMLSIADARFAAELAEAAKRAGKLDAHYSVDDTVHGNTPSAIADVFTRDGRRRHFPDFPLGTELTETEQRLAAALPWLAENAARPLDRLKTLLSACTHPVDGRDAAALARMGYSGRLKVAERLSRRLVAHALRSSDR